MTVEIQFYPNYDIKQINDQVSYWWTFETGSGNAIFRMEYVSIYNPRFSMDNYTLSIQNVQSQDEGRYTVKCWLGNTSTYSNPVDLKLQESLSSATRPTVTTMKLGPPCTPIDPAVEETQPNTVVISWMPCFHGEYAQTFVVQYSTDKVIWINATILDGGLGTSKEKAKAVLRNLQPDTDYYIRIFSYNVFGSSDFSEYLDVTTKVETFAQPQPETPVNSGALAAGCAVAGTLVLALTVSVFLLYRKGRLPGCRKSNVENEAAISSRTSETNHGMPGNTGNQGANDNLSQRSSSYENTAQQPTAIGTDEQTSVSVYDDLHPEKNAEHLYSALQGNRGNQGNNDSLSRSFSYENTAQQPVATGTDEQTFVGVYDDLMHPEKNAEHLYSALQDASSGVEAPAVNYSNLKKSALE